MSAVSGNGPEGAGERDMISCQEALERVYEYLDGELDASGRGRVREHITVCQECYPFFDFERLFLDFIREKGFRSEPNEELLRKVRAILRESE